MEEVNLQEEEEEKQEPVEPTYYGVFREKTGFFKYVSLF